MHAKPELQWQLKYWSKMSIYFVILRFKIFPQVSIVKEVPGISSK
jgi:hypothetical protein